MATTTITGLGSGMDINSIVTALVDAEKAPKQSQIDRQKTNTETTLSAVGTLQAALETFEASLSSLKSVSSNFAGSTAASSSENVATVTAKSDAVNGSYNLTVNNLATSSKVASASLAGGASTAFASGGTLKIDIGDNASYSVNVKEGATLTEIKDAINEQLSSSAGISANIISDSSGARLVLSSETTGEGTDLYVTGSGDLAALNINVAAQTDADGAAVVDANGQPVMERVLTKQSGSAAGYITEAKDASYSIDGLELTSSTNTTSAVSGLSITLAGEGTSTIKVGANTEGLKTSVETFVAAYNTLMTVTNSLTKVTATEDGSSTEAGALIGDSSVRSLLSSIRSALVDSSGSSGGLSVLSQLGVSTNKDGTLSIDDKKLETGLSNHYDSVAEFFTGDKGLISRLTSVTTEYSKSGGLIDSREDALKTKLSDLEDQQESLDRRIEKLETTLYSKYNNMDSLVSQLNSTSESVLQTLNALNNNDD